MRGNYLWKNSLSIGWRFATLVVPIVLGVLALTKYHHILYYLDDMDGYVYRINSILIVFIFMALVPVFVNLVHYLIDHTRYLWGYHGTNRSVLATNRLSLLLMAILIIAMIVFGGLISIRHLSFPTVIEYNRYISLAIFVSFLIIDLLLIRSECIEKKECEGVDTQLVKEKEVNIELSRNSTFLINIPTLCIIGSSWYIANTIAGIGFYQDVLDKSQFLFEPSELLVYSETAELFTNGIETGVLMTSIIFSQVVFFVIKTQWDYRKFRISKGDTLK